MARDGNTSRLAHTLLVRGTDPRWVGAHSPSAITDEFIRQAHETHRPGEGLKAVGWCERIASAMAIPELLVTARLYMRLPTIDDARAIYRSYASDPAAMRLFPVALHRTVADSVEYLQARIDGRASHTCWHWLITAANSGTVIGVIGLSFDAHAAEVGFILKRSEWGNGYATEALQAVLSAALDQPKIYRVWAWCDTENHASARVMEKAGMHCEGRALRYATLPSFGPEPRDAFIYAKVR